MDEQGFPIKDVRDIFKGVDFKDYILPKSKPVMRSTIDEPNLPTEDVRANTIEECRTFIETYGFIAYLTPYQLETLSILVLKMNSPGFSWSQEAIDVNKKLWKEEIVAMKYSFDF